VSTGQFEEDSSQASYQMTWAVPIRIAVFSACLCAVVIGGALLIAGAARGHSPIGLIPTIGPGTEILAGSIIATFVAMLYLSAATTGRVKTVDERGVVIETLLGRRKTWGWQSLRRPMIVRRWGVIVLCQRGKFDSYLRISLTDARALARTNQYRDLELGAGFGTRPDLVAKYEGRLRV
jgi:hypothetical protein